ncbi:hypothetical protein OXYTRIMIC_513 [Oxytricha trifallax]|uniref:Uncharacterized protein n=1 Tax=Oxytricha trifallax TaxID=1172189 RepID=A0A073I0E5_9SPIT|nr:hypothetical protein OXYTRIMIC_513 [Oxytricha trifallax]
MIKRKRSTKEEMMTIPTTEEDVGSTAEMTEMASVQKTKLADALKAVHREVDPRSSNTVEKPTMEELQEAEEELGKIQMTKKKRRLYDQDDKSNQQKRYRSSRQIKDYSKLNVHQ